MARRNLALPVSVSDNPEMDMVTVFLNFLQPVAVGTGSVFAILLTTGLVLPRRSKIDDNRRTAH